MTDYETFAQHFRCRVIELQDEENHKVSEKVLGAVQAASVKDGRGVVKLNNRFFSTFDTAIIKTISGLKDGDHVELEFFTTTGRRGTFSNISSIVLATTSSETRELPPAPQPPAWGGKRDDLIVKQVCLKVAGEVVARIVAAAGQDEAGMILGEESRFDGMATRIIDLASQFEVSVMGE